MANTVTALRRVYHKGTIYEPGAEFTHSGDNLENEVAEGLIELVDSDEDGVSSKAVKAAKAKAADLSAVAAKLKETIGVLEDEKKALCDERDNLQKEYQDVSASLDAKNQLIERILLTLGIPEDQETDDDTIVTAIEELKTAPST